MGKSRRDMRHPTRCICLPQPVGSGVLEFLEQKADHFTFFVQTRFRDLSVDEGTSGHQTGRDQQNADRPRHKCQFETVAMQPAEDHRRAGRGDEQDAAQRDRREHYRRPHHQTDDHGPKRDQGREIGIKCEQQKRAAPDQAASEGKQMNHRGLATIDGPSLPRRLFAVQYMGIDI